MNRIISPMVKESLKKQAECPKCHVSWTEIESSLHEPLDSPNWYISLTIIRNCDVCRLRFHSEVNILTGGECGK